MVPVPVLEQGRGRAFVHVCGCVLGLVPECACVHSCLLASRKRQCVDCC